MTGDGPPSITNITPTIAASGTSVSLSGMNFAPTAPDNLASVNRLDTPVSSVASTSSLALKLPTHLGSGHVSLQTPFGRTTSLADLYVPPAPYTSAQVAVAQRVTSGTSTQVTIPNSGNIGMLLIDGVTGQQASVLLTNSTFPGGCYSAVITVLKPDGSQLATTSICGQGTGFLDSFQLPVTGTYAVIIAPQNGGGSATATAYLYNDVKGPIALGTSQNFNTTIPGQNARYTFSGTAGQQINVALTNNTYSGCPSVVISILGPDGSQLAGNPNLCGTNSTVLSEVTLPSNGTYTILIDPQSSGTGSGTVSLSVDQQLGALTFSNSVPVNITIPGQSARFTFSGTAGQQVNLALTSSTFSGCPAVVISILKPDGTQLASSYACGINSVAIPDALLSTAGTYTVLIAPQYGVTGGGTVTLSVDEQLGSINVGSSAPVNVTVPGQNARFTFTGTAGQQVNLALTNSTFTGCYSVIASILNPDGSQLASTYTCGSGNLILSTVTIPVAGTYTILISPQYGGTGSGTITLSTDQQLGAIAANTSIPVNISLPGQNARFTFGGVAGQQINIAFTNSTVNGCYSVLVNVLNPSGSQVASSGVCGGNLVLSAVTLATSGTYTIVVSLPSGTTGSGTFTLSTDQQLGAITAGSSASFSSSLPGQNGRFTFNGIANQSINLALTNATFTGCYSVVATILNPDGSQLASSGVCGGNLTLSNVILATTGTYTIIIAPQGGGTGSATVLITGN